jgi:hypothetical protein
VSQQLSSKTYYKLVTKHKGKNGNYPHARFSIRPLLQQNAVCSDSYDRMQSVQTVMAECSLFRQLWQHAVCSDSYGRMQSVQTVMTECSLFRQLWQNAVCSDSYDRMQSVQTVIELNIDWGASVCCPKLVSKQWQRVKSLPLQIIVIQQPAQTFTVLNCLSQLNCK